MVYVYCGIFLVVTAVVSQSHAENEGASSDVRNLRDDKAYRIAMGEKYFSSLDNYDRDSWVDPYNMFDHDTQIEKEDKTSRHGKSVEGNNLGLSESEKPEVKNGGADRATATSAICSEMQLKPSKCNQNEYIYITRWLKKLLRKMNYSPDINLNEVQIVQFPVANRDLHEISKFLNSKDLNDVQDLESVFDGIVAQFQFFHPDSRSIGDIFYLVWDNSTLVLTLLACVISVWYLHALFYHQHILKMFIIFACFTSFIWTWIHLYQKEIAKQQATLHSSGYPEECQPIRFSYRSILKHIWKATMGMEDVCAKYYEAQIVDPFWKVSPLMVLSETVSNFVLQPLGSIASHCNMFLKNWYSDMSLFMMIPATCFAFIILLMLCRYRLRLPFRIFTLEPSHRASGMNRVEFLPFRNTDGHGISYEAQSPVHTSPQRVVQNDFLPFGNTEVNEIAHGEVQSSGHTSPQHAICKDFNAAGDHLQVDYCHDVQQEQMPLEVHELAGGSMSLKDQSSQTDEL